MKLRIDRSFWGYLLTGILMALVFLYLRFPGDVARDCLKNAAIARVPDMMLVIDSVAPTIPPGLVVENLTVGFRGKSEATLHADSVELFPAWLSLLQGRAGLVKKVSLYGGELRVKDDYKERFALQGPLTAEARFSGIKVDKCLWLQDFLARQVSGTLRGSFSFAGSAEALRKGAGKLEATLGNGSYQLQEGIMGFDRINFSRIDLKMELRNGALRISGLTVSGDKLRISLKGNILLAEVFGESKLDLSGSLELQGLGGRRMPVSISGVLENPSLKLM